MKPHEDNHCICCGELIPEGRQVCPSCERADVGAHDENTSPPYTKKCVEGGL